MPFISEYDYYEGTLALTVATQRPDAAPSAVLVSAALHEEWASRARCLLREYRNNLGAYLPYYRVCKLMPAGSVREIENNYDLLRMQFSVGFTLLQSAWTADETLVFAFERNIEKAVRDLFEAHDLPHLFIPGDTPDLGDSYIDVILSLGAATNQGAWQVPS